MLNALEGIDDDCDRHGILLVKIDDQAFAVKNGIDQVPALVYFEDGIPHMYQGSLVNEDEVLGWLIHQMKNDQIEEVTDEMLEELVANHEHVAVVVCKFNANFFQSGLTEPVHVADDANDRVASKVLAGLENIDDDLAKKDILIVKMEREKNDVDGLNVDEFPAIVFFDQQVPTVFQGDETREGLVLDWILDEANDEDPGASSPAETKPPRVIPSKKNTIQEEPKLKPKPVNVKSTLEKTIISSAAPVPKGSLPKRSETITQPPSPTIKPKVKDQVKVKPKPEQSVPNDKAKTEKLTRKSPLSEHPDAKSGVKAPDLIAEEDVIDTDEGDETFVEVVDESPNVVAFFCKTIYY